MFFTKLSIGRQLTLVVLLSGLVFAFTYSEHERSTEERRLLDEVRRNAASMYSIFSATLTEAVIVEDQPVIHSILEQLLIRDQRINRITVENENNLMLAQLS